MGQNVQYLLSVGLSFYNGIRDRFERCARTKWIISASGEFGLLQMVLEIDIERCVGTKHFL